MSVRQLKKFTKKAYKKAPKKKIIKTAASYGLQSAVGGPYLEFLSFIFSKSKKKAIKYAGDYAYDSFLKSKFARNKLNSVPMTIFTLFVRIFFNFLIFSRLKFGIYWLDFTLSILLTIIITLLTPFIYASVEVHEDKFLSYTNHFMDNFMGPGGWDYVEDMKNKTILVICLCILGLLQLFEVNSRLLQIIIIHALITGFISGQIQLYIDSLNVIKQLHYGMCDMSEEVHYIQKVIYPLKQAKKCHTKNRIFRELKPIKISKIKI